MDHSFSLHGKRALVTGGSRGIGRAICLALAEAGARVAFTCRENVDQAAQVVEAIRHQGGEARALAADVRDRSAVRAVCTELAADWGALDVLVNNAGINKPADFDQVTDADWDEILAVNLKGPFICTQEAWPLLKAAGSASVIHIGSVSGQYGGPRTAHYAASKAGLISLAQVIARFGARDGIRSNTIAGGIIASDMGAAGLASPTVSKAAENILLGHLGSPADMAAAAVFLASDASRYITAQTLNVNGGLYF
jgi:NAD(P)-dependent dehydrogenase (short-subunit alcohol dehydrogenase family)